MISGHPYVKMNGLGNEFVIIDLRNSDLKIDGATAAIIADRKTGPGCDQVITIEKRSDHEHSFMGVWNLDGSEVGACGNAARCVGSLLMKEAGGDRVELSTMSGVICAQRVGSDRVAVDMGEPKLKWRQIPLAEQMDDTRFIDIKLGPIDNPVLWGPSAVNMGNPHCIFFVKDIEGHAIEKFGPLIEYHPLFPERANVSIAQVTSKFALRLRVWERGVGITKACGTAACAAVVAANRRRLTERKATVTLDGGDLAIDWQDNNHVLMTGPVEYEGDGVFGDIF